MPEEARVTTLYPGATWRPIPRNYTPRARATTRGVILHTTASATATSMHSWFSNPRALASSHFHVDSAGRVEQYVDADQIAWTTGSANGSTVGIETQGDGTTPWTPAQVAALVNLLAWLCRTYDIPARAMTSSLPTERGIGWHRLGIDGNFPALPSVLAGRNQRGRGDLWSSARGKVCPGDARIHQIAGIVADVAKALAPKPTVIPLPTDLPEDQMIRTTRRRTKNVRLPKGTWKTLPLNDKGHTSAVTSPGRATITSYLALAGVPRGREVQVRAIVVETDAKGAAAKIVERGPIVELIGTGGMTFGQIVAPVDIPKTTGPRERRARIQVLALDDGITLTDARTITDHIPA